MKRLLILFAALFIGTSNLPADDRASVSPANPIVIGISAPLSGDLAEYGTAVRNGIQLAQEEDAASFRSIRFVFEDNKYEANAALTVFNKLRDFDKVDVLYSWGEVPLHAVAPLAEKKGVPLIAMSVDAAPSLGKTYILRPINYSEQYAAKVLEQLRRKGFKRFGVVRTDDPFLNSMTDGLRKNLRHDEQLVFEASVMPADIDFRSIITKLKAARIDALAVYLLSGQVSSFYKQAGAVGIKMPSFGTDVFESQTEISNANGAMDGAIYPNVPVPARFSERYKKQFRNENQLAYAYNAYVFARVSAKVFARFQERPSAIQVITSYAQAPQAETLDFQFRENGSGGKYWEFPIVVRRIFDNAITTIE